MDKFSKWTCVVCILLLEACGTFGKPFDASHIKDLKKGVTTKEVLDLFGPPFKKSQENGMETWTYFEKESSPFNSNLQKDLMISFDKNNVVKFFRYSSSNP